MWEFTDFDMGQGFAMTLEIPTRHLLDLDAKGLYAALDEGFSPSKWCALEKPSDAKERG
jgi:hypothetical protein